MTAEIGVVSLLLAFLAALYATVVSVLGEWKQREHFIVSGRNAALLTFPLLLISSGALMYALLTEQYNLSYVWSVTDPNTPLFYRISAFWGSQRGSLLFWCLTMSIFTFGAVTLNWRSDRRLMPITIAVMMANLVFFMGITLFIENPFARWFVNPATQETIEAVLIPPNAVEITAAQAAGSAQGLNPLLRHFGMIIHPPMLYLGFVSFVVPFAFAMAALASGDLTTNWIKATRRWSLVAWLFLSLGLILGGRWAYDVLGWGGYWGWDPVENAAFLPWLVGTAFIHSVMIQEKRGMLKVWNMVLVLATYSAVLFGTFATRSGVVESVHSFAESSIGFPMLTFWGSMTVIGAVMLLIRWNRGELRDEHEFSGLLSRETLFVLNNVIFMALTLAVFWGSFGAPIISELFLDTDITLGTEYFMSVTPPLFALMYILMGVAPLSAWSATSLRRLGTSLLVPIVLTIITLVVMVLTLENNALSLFAYGIVLLAGYVAIYETYRGAAARRRTRGESWLVAIRKLFGRNQRRYGGYLVHLGIVVIGIGVIGSTVFQFQTRRTLDVGDTTTVRQYEMTYESFDRGLAEDGRVLSIATLTISQNGRELATIRPRVDGFPNQNMMIAGAHSTPARDYYVLMDGFEENGQQATFSIYINPLINLVWWGSLILIVGTMAAAWPREILPEHLREKAKGNATFSAADGKGWAAS
jgi:cytochrome c-type biogenesis protein CcmF